MSFFMLLVVSLGLSVVKESLGKQMLRCQVLAAGHFIFGSKHPRHHTAFLLTLQFYMLLELSS